MADAYKSDYMRLSRMDLFSFLERYCIRSGSELPAIRSNAVTIQGLRCSTERVLLMQPRSVGAQSPV